MLTALADQTAATGYGYGTIASGMFSRASARVRLFAKSRGYSVDADDFTVIGRGPIVYMTNRPVRSITSVHDVSDPDDPYELTSDEWVLRSGGTLEIPAYGQNLSIVYAGGLAALPDELVELVCAVASRMANTSTGAQSGVQQETGGSESVTYGFDSFTGISDLTKGELASLRRMFPTTPAQVVLRP